MSGEVSTQKIVGHWAKVQRLAGNVYDLKTDADYQKWFNTSHAEFMDRTPAEIILSGDGRELIEWLEIRAGEREGALF